VRTVNIVVDQNGEFVLLLETKRKESNNKKSYTIKSFYGGTKKGLPCWRIDLDTPIEWVNLVSYNEKNIKDAIRDAGYSLTLYLLAQKSNIYTNLPNPINCSLLGEKFNSLKGQVPRISIYSTRMACDTLDEFIRTGAWHRATLDDQVRIARGILFGLKIMHDNGLVHCDFNAKNILIDRNEHGYYAKIIDFTVVDPVGSCIPLSSALHESPQVLKANKDKSAHNHNLYFKYYNNSYCQYLIKKMGGESYLNTIAIQSCSPKDDIWAAGLVLYQIFQGRVITQISFEKLAKDPCELFRKMLEPDQDKRIDINEALRLFDQMYPPVTFVSDPQLEQKVENLTAEVGSLSFSNENSFLPSYSGQQANSSNEPLPQSKKEWDSLDPKNVFNGL
jgi:serine/threonine protein kinase